MLRTNKYLFAGILYAAKSDLGISSLYGIESLATPLLSAFMANIFAIFNAQQLDAKISTAGLLGAFDPDTKKVHKIFPSLIPF